MAAYLHMDPLVLLDIGPLLIKTIHGNAGEIEKRKDYAGQYTAYLQLQLASVYRTLQPPAMSGIPAHFSAAVLFVAMLCICLLFAPAFIRPCILKVG